MKNSTSFFANVDCEYYPCHVCDLDGESFNCMFCYCPMNRWEDCLGTPEYFEAKDGRIIKDCSGCTFPHKPENYDAVVEFLKNH